jgi:molybdate transport system substrate-binding protein
VRVKQRKSGVNSGVQPTLGICAGTLAHSAVQSLTNYRFGDFLLGNCLRPASSKETELKSILRNPHLSIFLILYPILFLCVATSLLSVPSSAQAGPAQKAKRVREITVAAAADLSTALKEVADNYEKKTGTKVKLSFGASGALTQQIQNGAPFDIFFSADMDYPKQLISGGQADEATLFQYAVGKLVLWVPADSPLDVEHKGINTLIDPAVKKIAIANPQHAPYGRASVATLKHYGLYEHVSDRLVMGENISQAAQFVESGNAQIGFVAMAHATSPAMKGKGKYWEVPAQAYPALTQGVVVLAQSRHKKEAADFLQYVKTKEAGNVLRKYGFTLP